MSAVLVHSPRQVAAQLIARAIHGEPKRHLHDRDEYDERQRRIARYTREIAEVLCGPGLTQGVEI
jgi:hypothetical protein